jgi:hypothetical protein
MQPNRYLALLFGLIACAFPFVNTSDCHANLLFDVSLNTSPLIGNSVGPFYADFQLIDGGGVGDNNNRVDLSNLAYGGGSFDNFFGFTGGVSGNPTSTLTLTDSEFINEVFVRFNPGSTLSFQVGLSTNVDAGPTPDAFSFGILETVGSTLVPLPTGGLDALLLVDINQTSPVINTFTTSPDSPIQLAAPQISAVPESSSLFLVGVGLLNLIGFEWLRRKPYRCIRSIVDKIEGKRTRIGQ